MGNRFLDGLRSQREGLQTQIEELTNGAAEAERDLSEEELGQIRGFTDQLGPLDERIREMYELETSRLNYLDETRRVDGLQSGLRPEVTQPGGGHGQNPNRRRSWSDTFLESGALEGYNGRGSTRSVDVGSAIERARVLTSEDLEGLMPTETVPTPVQLQRPMPNMLSVVRTSPTTSSLIEYVEENQPEWGMAVVPEGQPKPETEISFTPRSAPIATIAHWVAATRQVLDDLPALRSYIDGRLREGLIHKIEDMVLNGDTTAGSNGLLTGAQQVAGPTLWEGLLNGAEAITEGYGYVPSAIVLNGRDWYAFLRQVLAPNVGTGRLADSVITDSLPYRVTGLPVVLTPAMPAGTVLIGDFINGAELWDRQTTQVFVADQHADFFVRNTLVILAEARLGLAIYQPLAFAAATIGGGNGGGGNGGGGEEPPGDLAARQRAAAAQAPAQAPARERRST
jgi:HK97 family phage major capsid protein